MKSKSVTVQIKAAAQSFRVVLDTLIYKTVLTFECVNEILKRVLLTENCGVVLSLVAFVSRS